MASDSLPARKVFGGPALLETNHQFPFATLDGDLKEHGDWRVNGCDCVVFCCFLFVFFFTDFLAEKVLTITTYFSKEGIC